MKEIRRQNYESEHQVFLIFAGFARREVMISGCSPLF
jgi:hypothetical protein